MVTRRAICLGILIAGIPVIGAMANSARALTPSQTAAAEGRKGGKTFKVDRILVLKGKRRMHLMHKGRIVRTYRIALGFSPQRHKVKQGDGRTPEGIYRISFRNPGSRFHLSLKVSYPNRQDRTRARRLGVDPGGDIFIHGQPRGIRSAVGALRRDWTLGCIAVSNAEIRELWRSVPKGTVIEIRA